MLFRAAMGRPGHALQVHFSHDKQNIRKVIQDIYTPAEATAKRLELNLDDLFNERVGFFRNIALKSVSISRFIHAPIIYRKSN